MTDLRLILAAETEKLPESLSTSGFVPMPTEDTLAALEGAGLWFGPRAPLEENESFRQIIPYLLIRVDGKLVGYTRAPSGGESRLHGMVSVGLGGHVDIPDAQTRSDERFDLLATLNFASFRELQEELGAVGQITKSEWVGMLADNDTPVGRVHLGVIGLWDVETIPDEQAEDAVADIRLFTYEELEALDGEDRLEPWTRILLPWIRQQIL